MALAQCVDFDGNGRPQSCGSGGNVPMPTGIERVDGGSSSGAATTQPQAAAKRVHQNSAPSMKAMVATTIMGSVLESVFSSAPSAPAPQLSAGPTAEQLEAQRKASEQQQRLMEERQQREFERANNDLKRKLKGGPSYVEDTNIVETGGLKLKALPPSTPSGDVHSGFFGIAGAAKPTVALLREPAPDGKLENVSVGWVQGPQQLIEQRMAEPNKWAAGAYVSLKTKAPPLPYKKFSELQSGDVMLIDAAGTSKAITAVDNYLSGINASTASHTVLYLRTVNGVKHFLENIPGEGPRIIFEDEFLRRYSARGGQVAQLAQPLNVTEAKRLYTAAVEMAAQNRKSIVGSNLLGTNYGVWGKDNVVCSEADWALLNMARTVQVPGTGDKLKASLGVDFSPADFFKNGQYFLVSRVDMPAQ
ncbi:MAG: hypothetical protein HQL19_04145 [Candidatus Omnitrophica bacterium]|nr:hypothetical protein [Candidatus Omnitrophota bacterium]